MNMLSDGILAGFGPMLRASHSEIFAQRKIRQPHHDNNGRGGPTASPSRPQHLLRSSSQQQTATAQAPMKQQKRRHGTENHDDTPSRYFMLILRLENAPRAKSSNSVSLPNNRPPSRR